MVYQGAFGVLVVINRGFQDRYVLDMEKVLQIEDHILTVADIFVHAYAVTLYDVPSVQLVPQDTVVKVRR